MGLDMYLTTRSFVKDHTVTITGPSAPGIRPERITEVVEEVAVWRGAHAIHQFFVATCQDGRDDCREACVPRSRITELVRLCQTVLDAAAHDPGGWPAVAESVLPPQHGSFFSGGSSKEAYLLDLCETIEKLQPVLAEDPIYHAQGCTPREYYYRSSW